MDARKWSRLLVDKDVPCTVAGREGRGFISDLSAGGCMIELDDPRDVTGSAVALDLYGAETTPGTVIWQWGRCVGVRFDAPIHEAVVRHVGFMPPVTVSRDEFHRDRFGRVLPRLDSCGRRPLGW